MKSKLYKILPAILLIAIVVVGAGMYVRFNGNPFIKVSLNKEAKNYVRQNYPEIADKVQLSPQGVYVGHYNDTPVFLAYFSNPDDKLMYFHLMYDKDGNFVYDGYSDHYMKGGTVYYYHSATYGGIVSELFNDYFCDGRGTASVSLDAVLNSNSGHGTFLDSDTDMYEGYKGPVLEVGKEDAPKFTYEEEIEPYLSENVEIFGDVRFRQEGFYNITSCDITTTVDAAERAEKECPRYYDATAVFYDPDGDVWKVIFYTMEKNQVQDVVYLDAQGRTLAMISQ